jgi:hypothetical protein
MPAQAVVTLQFCAARREEGGMLSLCLFRLSRVALRIADRGEQGCHAPLSQAGLRLLVGDGVSPFRHDFCRCAAAALGEHA